MGNSCRDYASFMQKWGFKTSQTTEKNARFAKKWLLFVKKNVKSEI